MPTLKLTKTYSTYHEYKDSGVEWLGEIPKDWQQGIMQHLFCKVKRAGFENEQLLSVYRDHGVIIKSSRDDNHNKASDDLSSYQLVEPGDLAINKMKAWQGSLAISDHRGIVSPAYYICRPLSQNNSRFFHYLLRSDIYIKQYERHSGGVRNDQWDLNYERFRKIEISTPSLEIQKSIANYLDQKTALVDQTIEKKLRQIELLREKRIAFIKEQLLGKTGWKEEKIKHLIKSIDSGVWGENPVGDEYDVKCLRVADFDYDNLDFSDVQTIRNVSNVPKRKILQKGDILVEKSGGGEKTPVGRAILFNSDERMVCANFIDIVRVNREKVLPDFLTLYLFVLYSGRINTKYIKQNTGIQNMDIKSYFHELITFPEMTIQEEIIEKVYEKMQEYDKAILIIEKSVELLREYKSSLISHVVTGKIKI